MIQVAICDDEKIIVSQIEYILQIVAGKNNILINVEAFYDGETLEKSILLGDRYDIIYLDIQMKNKGGIEAAKEIRKMDENALLVYVSGYDDYYMELFELNVFQFIKKPIDEEILKNNFLRAYRRICNNQVYFTFHYRGEEKKVLCSDILYFESQGRQIHVHLKNADVEIFNGKLNEIEEKLAVGKIPFLRIHQSYLLNYHLIRGRSKTKMRMINGDELPISEDRQKNINSLYNKLIGDEISCT